MGKNFSIISIVFCVLTVFVSQSTWATPDVNCTAPAWAQTPVINSDNRLVATLIGTCKITTDSPSSISSLDQHFIDSIPKQYTVNSGPTAETFQDLSSQLYAVTYQSVQDGDQITIESALHVATDQNTVFINATESNKVNGKGNASYLRVLNEEEDVTTDPSNTGTFNLKFVQMVEIQKPWYAPTSIFLSQAEKSLISSFTSELNDLSQTTAQQLVNSN